MASFTLGESEQVEFETIPADTVATAEVVNCEVKETPWLIDESDPDKGYKEQVLFRFKIVEGPYQGRQLFGNTPTTFTNHPDCKLRVWVQELLGMNTLPSEFTFDTDNLIGTKARIIVGNRPKKHRDGSSSLVDFVDTVVRLDDGMDYADDVF